MVADREREKPLSSHFERRRGVVAGREMGGREGGKPLRSRFERVSDLRCLSKNKVVK